MTWVLILLGVAQMGCALGMIYLAQKIRRSAERRSKATEKFIGELQSTIAETKELQAKIRGLRK